MYAGPEQPQLSLINCQLLRQDFLLTCNLLNRLGWLVSWLGDPPVSAPWFWNDKRTCHHVQHLGIGRRKPEDQTQVLMLARPVLASQIEILPQFFPVTLRTSESCLVHLAQASQTDNSTTVIATMLRSIVPAQPSSFATVLIYMCPRHCIELIHYSCLDS